MEYNIPNSYKDTTPAAQLDQKTLNKMVWRSLFLQGSFNYERMQAAGWLYGILPGLKKIHTNKDDLATSMSHNLEFFNTHPFLVTFVMGIILSLEQNKADIPTIRAVRVAAMGPLGGIGDALFWFTLVPITAGITSNMALQGQIVAPFIFLLIFNLVQFGIRYGLMNWSYKMGTQAISILTENAKEFTRAASILGVIVVGALTSMYGGTTIKTQIDNGTTFKATPIVAVVSDEQVKTTFAEKLFEMKDGKIVVDKDGVEKLKAGSSITNLENGVSQVTFTKYDEVPVKINIQNILDGILPHLIPLLITLGLYLLMIKKKFTPITCIGLLLVLGIVGGFFGIF
ncbi:MAG: PTS system mannose/fructose/sorbose family transporter subunit IID [Fusobacterium sp.]|nr:PTS system mannose/fructose/sorbose family transporter subunit IID [Fusobacterium sp.]